MQNLDYIPRPSSPTFFDCSVCLEDGLWEVDPKFITKDILICADCVKDFIVPLFDKALHYEIDYPVKWGELVLHPHAFAEELGADFLVRFEQVEHEYKTPTGERVYCKNKVLAEGKLTRGERASFLSPGALSSRDQIESAKQNGQEVVDCGVLLCRRRPYYETIDNNYLPRCWSCKGCACPSCGEAISLFSSRPRHICQHKDEKPEEVLKHLTRGKDYQICPNNATCGGVVQLKDGCNFVRCPNCRAGMCFVCGEGPMEEHGNRHWNRGNACPRFGQLGSRRALYDDEDRRRPLPMERRRGGHDGAFGVHEDGRDGARAEALAVVLRTIERRRAVERTVSARREFEEGMNRRRQLAQRVTDLQRTIEWLLKNMTQEEAQGPPVAQLALDLPRSYQRVRARMEHVQALDARVDGMMREMTRLDASGTILMNEMAQLEAFLEGP